MNRIDAKQLRYTELFLVEGKKIESGPNCGTEYRLVGQLENGDLIYIDQVPTEGAVTREEYYAISKQEYRDLLEKAIKNNLLQVAGKYGKPSLEELETLGRD